MGVVEIVTLESNALCHHGIKGMKWGVRQYQNPDGSLTPAGEARYNKNIRNSEHASSKELKYRAKASAARSKAEHFSNKRDKAKARIFQTDISIANAEKFDRKRARADIKARKYEKKADRAAKRADRWLERNEKLKKKPISNAKASEVTKSAVDDYIKVLNGSKSPSEFNTKYSGTGFKVY